MNYTKTLYIDCRAGISGDMLLTGLREIAAKAGIEVKMPEIPKDGGNPCKQGNHDSDQNDSHGDSRNHLHKQGNHVESQGHDRINPHYNHNNAHAHGRSYSEVKELIKQSDAGDVAKVYALNIYEAIAKAEARVHEKTLETVHFHEVGRDKAIENALGTGAILEALGALPMYKKEQKNIIEIESENIETGETAKKQDLPVSKEDRNTENPGGSREENKNVQIKSSEHQSRLRILVSPIYDGTGFVDCAHGRISVPVPAVQAMKKQCPYFEFRTAEEVKTEMVTPSGLAALIGIGAKPADAEQEKAHLREHGKTIAFAEVKGTRNTGRGGLRLFLYD